ncbi:unnamed protein product [Bursaphelenchus xylophilus]|uniref:(pine wood nematode) hypothetical protein n=1 Tax=Bursaphelenchus xylophilus TaxID=6326 RepID=A0A1I7S531_BURXY|nr:unnamed protein product [Bursaphelenchus xylophilus]CAG9117646.1 unnamed protein product [Bursaphelenchus xylophilus]
MSTTMSTLVGHNEVILTSRPPSPRLMRNAMLPSLVNENLINCKIQEHKVNREERASILGRHSGFRGCTLWFTGLSGAGKTTLSFALEKILVQLGIPAYGLDGDNVRHGLCKNLGFQKEERAENIRRVAELSKLCADMGMVMLASFISPYRVDRDNARSIHDKDNLPFFEVHVSTALEVCEARDIKGLYKKARLGQIRGFTGIDSDYEVPVNPDLVLDTAQLSEAECVQRLLEFLVEKNILPKEVFTHFNEPPVKELFVKSEEEKTALVEASKDAPELELELVDLQWLQVLAEGWATPLTGFMRERQYLQALHFDQLFDLSKKCASLNGGSTENAEHIPLYEPISQSVPIVLPINEEQKAKVGDAKIIKLSYNNKLVAVLEDPEIFPHHKMERVQRQFACTDRGHPTVDMILNSGDWCLGGDIKVFERIRYDDGLDQYRKTPNELRAEFAAKGSDCVFAFQLRNPIHNGHALLMKETREMLSKRYQKPMLLLHPLGGWTKDSDVPLPTRIRQHEEVLKSGTLSPEWTVLAIFPSPMLYAGPTEVQWHARARVAAGVAAYIVGRDPAGIQDPKTGDYLYDPTHGAKVLAMTPGLTDLEIIPFRVAAYDKKAGKMSFFDESRKEDFEFISGTKMRGLAKSGEEPPNGFMVPEAWKVLADYYKSLAQSK